jgi:hypothetical protein
MNAFLHLLIIFCGVALMPDDIDATDLTLFILMQLLILIFNLRTFKQGMLVGKDIVWKTLAETMDEKNIQSVKIRHKTKL